MIASGNNFIVVQNGISARSGLLNLTNNLGDSQMNKRKGNRTECVNESELVFLPKPKHPNFKDITGEKHSLLTVLGLAE